MASLTPSVTDFGAFSALRNDVRQSSPDALEKVTQQFESVFTHMLLKNMRQASLAPDPFAGPGSETCQDLMDQQWALTLSQKGGLGLAEALRRQLQPKAASTPEAAPAAAGKTERAATPSATTAARPPLLAASNAYRQSQGHCPPATPEEFMAQVWPAAEKAAAQLGISPRVLVAQAALETGWGRSTIRKANGEAGNNYFGIKSHGQWAGEQVRTLTNEFHDGVKKVERAAFRAYDSVEASFNDFVAFLKGNPRYRDALSVADQPHQFVDALQKAGYATDPDYASKIKSIMNGRRMNQYVAGLDRSTSTVA